MPHPRLKSLIAAAALVWAPTPSPAWEGVVETFDGRTFTGHVRWQTNLISIANLTKTYLVGISLTNIRSMRFVAPSQESRLPAAALPLGLSSPSAGSDTTLPSPAARSVSWSPDLVRLPEHGRPISESRALIQFSGIRADGDGEISTRLIRLSGITAEAKPGLMFREGFEPGSRSVCLALTPRGSVLSWRSQPDSPIVERAMATFSPWLRLLRQGDWFYAYTAPDGVRWSLLDKVQIVLAQEALAGCVLGNYPVLPEALRTNSSPPHCLFGHTRAGKALRYHSFVPRCRLVSGSSIAEEIAYANDRAVVFSGPAAFPAVARRHIHRLDFQWVPSRLLDKVKFGRPGVLLATGEFIEGDLRSLDGAQCVMSTVLLGLREYDARHEVLSIVLHPPRTTSPPPAEVRTWNGSQLRGLLSSLQPQQLLLEEPSLGKLELPYSSVRVLEVSRR